jgi:hypothetical protein
VASWMNHIQQKFTLLADSPTALEDFPYGPRLAQLSTDTRAGGCRPLAFVSHCIPSGVRSPANSASVHPFLRSSSDTEVQEIRRRLHGQRLFDSRQSG